MKNTGECARCKNRSFYVLEPATTQDPRYSNASMPVGVAFGHVPTGGKGIFGGEKRDHTHVTVDAWVCSKCGYTDLYVRDLAALAKMVDHPGGRDANTVQSVRFVQSQGWPGR